MNQTVKNPPILLVDDEPDLRNGLEMLLTKKGHTVLVADSAASAIELLKKRVKDLASPYVQAVISDWMMPGGTGLDLLASIRKAQELRSLPFVLMSGNVTKDELMGAVRFDLDAVILKPFGPDDLIAKVKDAVAKRDKKELDILMK